MALLEDCVERAVALAATCGWLAFGGGLDAAVGVTVSGVGIAANLSRSMRGHGPESKRVLKVIRKRVLADLYKRADIDQWDHQEDFKTADAAMERALSGCFLDRKSLAASARSPEGFPGAATEVILSKLAEREPKSFGSNGSNAAKEYAKLVIHAALEAAIDNETYFKSLDPHLTMEALRGIGKIEHIVIEGFSDAIQHREQLHDKLLNAIGDKLNPSIAHEETPDNLPEPILIESIKILGKKRYLGRKYKTKKEAVIAETYRDESVVAHPSEGLEFEVEHNFLVNCPIGKVWDIILLTEYMGHWNTWIRYDSGIRLPNAFDCGSLVSDDNDHKIVWCSPEEQIIFRGRNSHFYEICMKKISNDQSKITMRQYQYNIMYKSKLAKIISRTAEYFFSTGKIKESRKNSAARWNKQAAMDLELLINQIKYLGKPSNKDAHYYAHKHIYSSGILKFYKDENAKPLLTKGKIIKANTNVGYYLEEGKNEEEIYYKENCFLSSPPDTCEVVLTLKKEGDYIKYGDILAFYRRTTPEAIERVFETGYSYETGDGIEQNYPQAAAWYAEAANHNHAPAINNLAVLYQNGNGVSKKPKIALRLFMQAAELGHPTAKESAEHLQSTIAKQS